MKIATWNVNSLRMRLAQVLEWLAAEKPDILALQETKLPDEAFPAADIEAAGCHAIYLGQKTYNGVALLTREPAHDVVHDLPGLDDPARRVLGATCGPVRVLNLYVPNGEAVESPKYAYKLKWLDKLVG
jgi:exodeoxyribonuclease III (xth)